MDRVLSAFLKGAQLQYICTQTTSKDPIILIRPSPLPVYYCVAFSA